ncbi:MAG: hypothetical protein KDH96_02065 [Candidatus Riesia sp.]|nr:hypothetical protein [Candidatus Riesia sp.]
MEQDKREIAQTEQQLREAIAAERFFETESGRLFQDLANRKINFILKDITSDKFVKDHAGYVSALADLNAYKYMLRAMQVAGLPERINRLKLKLGEFEENGK